MSSGKLEDALRSIGRSRRRSADQSSAPTTFRAVIEERLRNVERQLDELKGRVNGLLFLLAGAVATEVLLRLFR